MLSWNCKNVQHVKIYLHYNFSVNPFTHFGVIALFSSPVWAIAITWHPSSVCKLFQKSSTPKPLDQFKPNLDWIILRGFPLKCMSDRYALHPRWPPLLKIDISSNGQNCFILCQNVPTFELYKHKHELFNIYYGIFYELWTFADFDRLCKLGINKQKSFKNLLVRNHLANFNQTLSEWSLGGPLSQLCPSAPSCIQDGHRY
jgi:hypothetical protein